MKKSSSYKMRIPIAELLDHPDAWLSRDVLSQTGSTVLIPSKIPIGKLVEGLDNPQRIVDSLERLGIKTVDIELTNEMDDEEIVLRLTELDPSAVVIDNEITRHAQKVVGDIYTQASLGEKFHLPNDAVEDLGKDLSKEIAKVSQISLSMVASDQDEYTYNHALNVAMLSGYTAKKLIEAGLAPESLMEKTILAGLLFDIGKGAIPKEILQKKGSLTPDELAIMRGHIGESLSICKASGIMDKDILDGIAAHHERYDGSGYPRGLVGTQIPIIGRILAVADTFDAMTSSRVYKDAVSSKLSFNFIMSENETKFDPDICRIFVSGMGVYPPGSVVELSDGRVGTVVAVTPGNLLQPKVAVKDANGKPQVIDLAKERCFVKRSLDMEPRDEVDFLQEETDGK